VRIRDFLEFLLTGEPISDRERAEVRSEVSFSEAIDAHLEWKHRLISSLGNPGAESLIPDDIRLDTRCELGQWIHGAGNKRYRKFPAFTELREKHAEFHLLAHRIVELSQSQQHEAAQALMKGDFQQTSMAIVSRIRHLSTLFGS
jgi:hypothetical protein